MESLVFCKFSFVYDCLPRLALTQFLLDSGERCLGFHWLRWFCSLRGLSVCTGGWDSSWVPWSKMLGPKRPTKVLLCVCQCLIHWLKQEIKRRNVLCHRVADITPMHFLLKPNRKIKERFTNLKYNNTGFHIYNHSCLHWSLFLHMSFSYCVVSFHFSLKDSF